VPTIETKNITVAEPQDFMGSKRVCEYRGKKPWALREKHFQERTAEPRISPLRYAPVEMTKGRAALPWRVVAKQKPIFIIALGPVKVMKKAFI
jgi:hypothetical protein